MAITLRAAGANATGTTSVTCSQPTGTLTNDVLVAFIVDHSVTDGQSAAPTGWQARGYTRNVGGRRFQVFTAVVGKNSLTGTSWTFSGLTTRSQGMIIGYYNADTTGYGGFDTSVSVRDNASGTYGTLGITPVTNGAMIIAAFCSYVAATTYAWTSEHCDTIGNLVERFDNKNSTYCSLAVADLLLATAGPTGESGATPTTGQNNGGILLALKPGVNVYDETGKLQVVLAAQGRSDTHSMSETAKLQTVLAAQGRSDAQSMIETAKMQAILCVQGEADGLLFIETGLVQVILATQGQADHLSMSEVGKIVIALAALGKSDFMQMSETAKLQVILATQGKQDVMTLPELGREQVILAVLGKGDSLVANEALEQTVIVVQGHTDLLGMSEQGKEVVILAVLGEFDELIPGSIYFGILKRWDGALWVKEPVRVYLGSWQAKPLKIWDGTEWKLVDTTGS